MPHKRHRQGTYRKKELTRRLLRKLSPLKTTPERYRETFERLGFVFSLPNTMTHRDAPLPEAIARKTGPRRGFWIGVAPFAKHKGKIYPIPLSDKLLSLLNDRYDRIFIFGGGRYEKEFAEGMEKRYDRVISAIGCLSLGQEMDLIASLDVIVTMDSSSMHMASLVGTPAVSVWGATHPYAGFYGFGQRPDLAVQLDLPCRPCSVYGEKECIFHDYRCLKNIPPEMIADKVAAVLAGQGGKNDSLASDTASSGKH